MRPCLRQKEKRRGPMLGGPTAGRVISPIPRGEARHQRAWPSLRTPFREKCPSTYPLNKREGHLRGLPLLRLPPCALPHLSISPSGHHGWADPAGEPFTNAAWRLRSSRPHLDVAFCVPSYRRLPFLGICGVRCGPPRLLLVSDRGETGYKEPPAPLSHS
ncbi:hypothetical protein VTK73DRAFT_1359 [Phialemonium thermophilum]|uniref:Uncharacterized protein n=1 Tax=Phialemonium thermophilum TaxID=223376 RepID=A0ABR3VTJ9_9PEZI